MKLQKKFLPHDQFVSGFQIFMTYKKVSNTNENRLGTIFVEIT